MQRIDAEDKRVTRVGKDDVIEVVRRYKDLVVSAMGPVKVYLYGSYSKGTAREDSDIDVAVVVPELNDDFLHASSLLWSLTWNVDASIEPVLIDARCPSPLYEDIIATGISV